MTLSKEDLQKAYAERGKAALRNDKLAGKLISAYAETILEFVQPNHLTLDLFNSFMPTRQLNPGDNLSRRLRKGKYKVRTFVPGTQALTDKTTWQDQYVYMFDRLIAGVTHNTLEIESGDIGTVEEMRRELTADLVDAIVTKCFTLLGSVWSASNTPNNFIDASSGGITATVLDSMIENVAKEAGDVVSIIGTREALLPVYKFAGFVEYANSGSTPDRTILPVVDKINEYANTRRIREYHGATLVELPSVRQHRLPGYNNELLDTSKVIVNGGKAGEIVLYGGVEEQDYTDMRVIPPEYSLWVYRSYSMLVDMPENIGIIKVK